MEPDFDIESDLWGQAEFPRPETSAPTQRSMEYRASLFDYDVSQMEYEHKPEIKYVRGRPLKIYDREEKPGGYLANTTRQIREVSGLGYSNELIEQSVENYAKLEKEEPIKKPASMPELAFRVCSSSSSSGSSTKGSKSGSSKTDNSSK